MRCANTEALNKYLLDEERAERENEMYEVEFLNIIDDLKKYASSNDKLELLEIIIREEFNL